MTAKNQQSQGSNKIKPPEEWTTGEEPVTGAQESYLHTLAREAGEPLKEDLTKAEVSEKIDELQHKTGRGMPRGGGKGHARKGGRQKK